MLNGGSTRQVKTFTALTINQWYGVKGHEGSGVKLPNQYIFVIAKNTRTSLFNLDAFTCHHYMVMYGQMWVRENHTMTCAEVGVDMGDHGINDIHLEKMSFEEVAQELATATGQYREIQEERTVKGMKDTNAAMHKEIHG